MKIGINARFLHSTVLEGVGRYTWETTKRMIQNHPEDEFYLFFDRPFPKEYVIASNVHPVIVKPQARHPMLFWYWFEKAIPKRVEQLKIEVFYSPDNFMSLHLKIPTLLVVHDLAFIHYPKHIPRVALWYYQYYMPKFIKAADKILTVSHYVKSDILINYSIPKEKVEVGYNAGFKVSFVKKSNSKSKPYFIYIGSLNPRKNISRLLKAFKMYHGMVPDVHLKLVGKAYNLTQEDNLLLNEMIAQGLVSHEQNLSDNELKERLANALGLVYVSLFEGFGIPILEAMSYGVPVVTSNVTSMPEVAGDAALLVDPEDVNDICNALLTISKDTNVRKDLIQKGFERVKEFSWDKTSDIVYANLQSLAKK